MLFGCVILPIPVAEKTRRLSPGKRKALNHHLHVGRGGGELLLICRGQHQRDRPCSVAVIDRIAADLNLGVAILYGAQVVR